MRALKLEENQVLLNTDEVAELCKTSQRTVQRWIKANTVQSIVQFAGKGRGGITHLIPLSALDDQIQMKYWKMNKSETLRIPEVSMAHKRIDEYSAADRKVIQRWIDAINSWQIYRNGYKGQKTAVDEMWARTNTDRYPDINLSVDNLYRKWKAFRENDFDGLIDKRGRWAKGTNSIPEVAWEIFKYYFLDEAQHPVSKCYQYMNWYFEKEMPELLHELPSYHAFNRAIKTIPFAVVKLFREGDKAFEDDAAPYVSRMYEDLEVNEVWVADSHTLDVMTIDNGTEKVHRLTVISFVDARSRIVTGWHITNNPSSEGVLYALRKGILKYGIPKHIYTDNGKEFLCFDIGGRGHRKSRDEGEKHTPPGVFARLGITMWNAQVRNAKAKIIERVHKEFKDNFSRVIDGFCGGNVLEKPEKLKKTLKTRKGMLWDSELIENFNLYIEGMYNETESRGIGMRGRSPIDVYQQDLFSKRTATEDDLNLMLMRSTRMQKVGRKGVHIDICGEKLYYWTPQFVFEYQGKEVYVRYDPENLENVRVYNEADEYMCTVKADEAYLQYGTTKEQVKAALHETKSVKKLAKKYHENDGIESMPKISAMSIMLWKAEQNIIARNAKAKPEAKVMEPVRANEPVEKQTVEVGTSSVSLDRMIQNSKRNAM